MGTFVSLQQIKQPLKMCKYLEFNSKHLWNILPTSSLSPPIQECDDIIQHLIQQRHIKNKQSFVTLEYASYLFWPLHGHPQRYPEQKEYNNGRFC
jgi:hypothetical protein